MRQNSEAEVQLEGALKANGRWSDVSLGRVSGRIAEDRAEGRASGAGRAMGRHFQTSEATERYKHVCSQSGAHVDKDAVNVVLWSRML